MPRTGGNMAFQVPAVSDAASRHQTVANLSKEAHFLILSKVYSAFGKYDSDAP